MQLVLVMLSSLGSNQLECRKRVLRRKVSKPQNLNNSHLSTMNPDTWLKRQLVKIK